MTTAYTQQIIINSSEELLKDPFLPLAERVKKRTESLYHKEESLRGFIKSSTDDTSQVFYPNNQVSMVIYIIPLIFLLVD